MNNSFIFTQPATTAGVEGRGSRVESQTSTRHATAPTQPFSNVLDRAVQTPPKKVAEKTKQESLTGGRSAEHRSPRSVEAHAEHKPSAPPRTSRRKEKSEDEAAMQSAVAAGVTAPIVKPDELTPASGTSDAAAESSITVKDCCAQKTSTEAPAMRITTEQTTDAIESTAGTAAIALESFTLIEGGEVATDENLPVDLKPFEQAMGQGEAQATKDIASITEAMLTDTAGEFSTDDAMVNAGLTDALDMQAMVASTAREALRGTARGESVLDSAIEISQTTATTDAATVESVVTHPITAEEARRSARVDRGALTETREKVRGTAAAKMTMSMNNEANREEIAGLTQQILPSGGVSQLATGINLPSESEARRLRPEVGSLTSDIRPLSSNVAVGPARTDVSLNGEMLDVRETSPAARIGEVISREVRMFKRGGDDMVEVVLTPDAKTQISLKLQWRDGQVEVQARCDMGDHRFLNTQWSQLQASFAAHGVRLSHLSERAHTGFTEFFGNSGFSQQQGGERQPAPQQSAIDLMKPAVPTPKTGAARSVVRASNRLESWA